MKLKFLFTLLAVGSLVFPYCCPKGGDEKIEGCWEGSLELPAVEMRIAFKIAKEADGSLQAFLLRPELDSLEIPAERASFEKGDLRIDIGSGAGSYVGRLTRDGLKIEGKYLHPAWGQELVLQRVAELTPLRRPQTPVPPYPYDEEEVAYTNDYSDCSLAGTLTIPREQDPCPAALLVSGGGAQDRDGTIMGHRPFHVLADYLTRRGIAVLRVDDRGVGASTGDRSEATSEDYARDALAGVAYLKGYPGIDPEQIGLIGHSEGGIIASLAAAGSRDVAFLVLMASPGLRGDLYNYQYEESMNRALGRSDDAIAANRVLQERVFAVLLEQGDAEARKEKLRRIYRERDADMPEARLEAAIRRMVSPWFLFLLNHDPGATLREVKCPVLALFGSKDVQVPHEGNREAVEQALASRGGDAYRVLVLDDLNHLFQTAETGVPQEHSRIEETMSPAVLDLIGDWILDQ
jgi:pimeloyl-ACP methyl ester carboxylesterase